MAKATRIQPGFCVKTHLRSNVASFVEVMLRGFPEYRRTRPHSFFAIAEIIFWLFTFQRDCMMVN